MGLVPGTGAELCVDGNALFPLRLCIIEGEVVEVFFDADRPGVRDTTSFYAGAHICVSRAVGIDREGRSGLCAGFHEIILLDFFEIVAAISVYFRVAVRSVIAGK